MKARLCGFLLVLCCCVVSGSRCDAASAERCDKAVARVQFFVKQGDIAVAKLLVDFAADDVQALGCSEAQTRTVGQLLDDIYYAYIVDHLNTATDDITVRHDGRKAYHNLELAINAAHEIKLELKDVNGLLAAALVTMASQTLKDAAEAEQQGDADLRDYLRGQAAIMMREALILDPRVEKLLKKAAKP